MWNTRTKNTGTPLGKVDNFKSGAKKGNMRNFFRRA